MTDSRLSPSDLVVFDALRGGGRPLLAPEVARLTGFAILKAAKILADLSVRGYAFRKTRITGTLVQNEYIVHPTAGAPADGVERPANVRPHQGPPAAGGFPKPPKRAA